ncbi:hypothetical protein ACIG5D_36430 [Microbispora rosea]|uniref:hypothetical protein n=1 Tax=Microbispora rosea TaxID=58117 RepID=UPI0037C7912E
MHQLPREQAPKGWVIYISDDGRGPYYARRERAPFFTSEQLRAGLEMTLARDTLAEIAVAIAGQMDLERQLGVNA